MVVTEAGTGALDLSYDNFIRFSGSSRDYSIRESISLGAGETGTLKIQRNKPLQPGVAQGVDDGLEVELLGGETIANRNGSMAGYPACAVILRDSGLENVEVPLAGYRGFDWRDSSTSESMRRPKQIQFDFAPDTFHGMTFGFDVDIDSVPSDQGRALAGTRVEIHLQDGTVLEGFTLPDDARPNRSLIGW